MLSKTVETRTCLYFNLCKKTETYNGRKWQLIWNHYKDGFLCRNHYSKIVSNPKQTKEYKKKYNSKYGYEYRNKYDKIRNTKLVGYKGRQIVLSFNPRKGFCNWCPNNIFNGSCKRTHKHHIEYYPIFVWFGTVEICNSCHAKETNVPRDLKTGNFIRMNK